MARTQRDFTGGGPAKHRESNPGSRYWVSRDEKWAVISSDHARRPMGQHGPKGRHLWSEFRIYLRGPEGQRNILVAQTNRDATVKNQPKLKSFADCVAFINKYETSETGSEPTAE